MPHRIIADFVIDVRRVEERLATLPVDPSELRAVLSDVVSELRQAIGQAQQRLTAAYDKKAAATHLIQVAMGVDEGTAYRQLRGYAMQTRQTVADLARRLLDGDKGLLEQICACAARRHRP